MQPFVHNNGTVPETSTGMQESLEWPISPQIQVGKGQVLYNSIAGLPGGEFPSDISYAIKNFDTVIAPHIDAWLTGSGIPSDFDGWAHEDLEKWAVWSMKGEIYNAESQHVGLAEEYPMWSMFEAWAVFHKKLYDKIRELRPSLRGITSYGLGGVNPNYMIWHWDEADAPNYRNRTEYLRQAELYGRRLRSESLGGTKESGSQPIVPAHVF